MGMRLKTKLLLNCFIAGIGAALAGASGIVPLWRLTHEQLESLDIPGALRTAIVICVLAIATSFVIGVIIARGVTAALSRFRRDADALASGKGEPLRPTGTDEIDQIGMLFNDFHGRIEALAAKQIKEEELVAAKRYADNVIKSMFDILIVTDSDLRIQTVNKSACELLEYTELELVGRPIESLFKEEPTFLGTPIREVLRSNQMRDFEATYQT